MGEGPTWLPDEEARVGPETATVSAPTYQDAPAYAGWYAWSLQAWPDPARAHLAAATAWAWMRAGHDRDAAAGAAKQAALAGSAGAVPMAGSVVRQYAEWYAWCLRDLKLGSAKAHVGAQAAQQALALGASRDEAALTAQRAAASVR